MRYHLRTLVIMTAIGPPVLAGVYCTAVWLGTNPIVFTVLTGVGALAAWIIAPIAWYYELVYMVCGPDPFRPSRRKKRRIVRVRIERCAYGST